MQGKAIAHIMWIRVIGLKWDKSETKQTGFSNKCNKVSMIHGMQEWAYDANTHTIMHMDYSVLTHPWKFWTSY